MLFVPGDLTHTCLLMVFVMVHSCILKQSAISKKPVFEAQSLQPFGLRSIASLPTLNINCYQFMPKARYSVCQVDTSKIALSATSLIYTSWRTNRTSLNPNKLFTFLNIANKLAPIKIQYMYTFIQFSLWLIKCLICKFFLIILKNTSISHLFL